MLEHLKECAFIENTSVLKAGVKMHVNSDFFAQFEIRQQENVDKCKLITYNYQIYTGITCFSPAKIEAFSKMLGTLKP